MTTFAPFANALIVVPVIWIVASDAPATSAWRAGGPPEWSVNSTLSPRFAKNPSRSAIWRLALVALSEGSEIVRTLSGEDGVVPDAKGAAAGAGAAPHAASSEAMTNRTTLRMLPPAPTVSTRVTRYLRATR